MQRELGEVSGFASERTVTITNAEHVHRLTLLNVRSQDKRVLILLVRIARLAANSSGKCKLLYDVFLFYLRDVRCIRRSGSLQGFFKAVVSVGEALTSILEADWSRSFNTCHLLFLFLTDVRGRRHHNWKPTP